MSYFLSGQDLLSTGKRYWALFRQDLFLSDSDNFSWCYKFILGNGRKTFSLYHGTYECSVAYSA